MVDLTPQASNSQEEGERPPLQSFISGQQTTQQPAGNSAQNMPRQFVGPTPAPKKQTGNLRTLLIVSVIIVIVIAAALALTTLKPSKSTTTVPTTTVSTIKAIGISNCTTITSPGRYYISKNIATKKLNGVCINITSSNVELIGNGNLVTGNGPYVDLPPFTYGIFASNVSNVTIQGVGVSAFSFGIYMDNVSYSTVSRSNVTKNVISGIYLVNSNNNVFMQNYVSGTSGTNGAVYFSRSSNNLFENNTVSNNAYYGIIVNSTGNTFYRNYLSNNPVDIMCNVTAGYADANKFNNSTCSINYYCAFAQCSVKNIPPNLESVSLHKSISSCGSINQPGTYALARNINEEDYLNTSNPLSSDVPCIDVNASNVNLNCKGYSIYDSAYGISVSGEYNVTLQNCKFENNTYGIALENTFSSDISNVSASRNVYGIYLNNATTGKVYNYSATKNEFATYINYSSGFLLSNYSAFNNTYGIFFSKGNSNVFSNDKLEQNAKADFYCTAQSYNSTLNLAQHNTCGVTDCNWVSCTQHALPPISTYPLSNCSTISSSGNYSINKDIATSGTCFVVTASNVQLSCGNHQITGNTRNTAFVLDNVENVKINNCTISRFSSAFNASDSKYINISNIRISTVGEGINFENTSYSKLTYINLSQFSSNNGIRFYNVSSSIVSNDSISNGVNTSSVGFVFDRSNNNLISFNNVTSVEYGMSFVNSTGNQVFNNTAYSTSSYGYYCLGNSTGIYANKNGINFGGTKYNCVWLVELDPLVQQSCFAISSASQVTLQRDMLYPYGNTCFNIYDTASSNANNTVLNCNGHTILATNGGTFVRIVNSTNVKIENCYLKNFTAPIVSSGGYTKILNNTIATANESILIENTKYPKVSNNKIMNASYGIVFENTYYGSMYNNSAQDTNIGYEIVGGEGYQVYNNSAAKGSVGMYVINTTIDSFGNNYLTNMNKYGIACTGQATNTSSLDKDEGGNICSSNNDCMWMVSSPSCKV